MSTPPLTPTSTLDRHRTIIEPPLCQGKKNVEFCLCLSALSLSLHGYSFIFIHTHTHMFIYTYVSHTNSCLTYHNIIMIIQIKSYSWLLIWKVRGDWCFQFDLKKYVDITTHWIKFFYTANLEKRRAVCFSNTLSIYSCKNVKIMVYIALS